MNEQDQTPRSREGEKFIEESLEGPYQFDDAEGGEDVIEIPNGTIVVRQQQDELIDAIAAFIYAEASSSVSKFGDFQLALSNAKDLEPLYERLMYDPIVRGLPWQSTHLWCVDGTSECTLVKEIIVDHSGIPSAQVHRTLPEVVEGKDPPRLDCVVLQKHCASLDVLSVRTVVLVSSTVDECKQVASTCTHATVRGFVRQENH
ncbi:MAG: hypothetical protein QGI78_04770 [Phycisphaerales bacterium]|nr:hypothetical protein [Phycisphaerales bacterium]